MLRIRNCIWLGLAGLLCVLCQDALAANCLVNAATDINFGSGDAGDLRYCINRTNNNAGADTITFDINGSILLNSRLPAITDGLSIRGENHQIVVDGQNRSGTVPLTINAS